MSPRALRLHCRRHAAADPAPPVRRLPAERQPRPAAQQGGGRRGRLRRDARARSPCRWPRCGGSSALPPESRAIVQPVSSPGSRPATSRVGFTLRLDPLSAVMILVVTGIGSLIHIYSTAYMHEETRLGVRALLLVPEPVRRVHARARARRELPGDVRRLGGRRPLLVPADRLLVSEEVGVRRRQEGVHRQPHRRLRVHPRRAAALRPLRHARLPGGRARGRRAQPGDGVRHGLADHAAAVRRRDRQVGADSALRLAAGRDGRPDAGLGAHPCGDDGDGGRVHDRAQRRALQPRAADAGDRRGRSAPRRR